MKTPIEAAEENLLQSADKRPDYFSSQNLALQYLEACAKAEGWKAEIVKRRESALSSSVKLVVTSESGVAFDVDVTPKRNSAYIAHSSPYTHFSISLPGKSGNNCFFQLKIVKDRIKFNRPLFEQRLQDSVAEQERRNRAEERIAELNKARHAFAEQHKPLIESLRDKESTSSVNPSYDDGKIFARIALPPEAWEKILPLL